MPPLTLSHLSDDKPEPAAGMIALFRYGQKHQVEEVHLCVSKNCSPAEIIGEYSVVVLKPGTKFTCTVVSEWPYYNQDWVAYHVKHTSNVREVSQFITEHLTSMNCVKTRGLLASVPLIGWIFTNPYIGHDPELVIVSEVTDLTMTEAVTSILNASNAAFCYLYHVPAVTKIAEVEASLSALSGKKASGVTRVPLGNKPSAKRPLPVIPE